MLPVRICVYIKLHKKNKKFFSEALELSMLITWTYHSVKECGYYWHITMFQNWRYLKFWHIIDLTVWGNTTTLHQYCADITHHDYLSSSASLTHIDQSLTLLFYFDIVFSKLKSCLSLLTLAFHTVSSTSCRLILKLKGIFRDPLFSTHTDF